MKKADDTSENVMIFDTHYQHTTPSDGEVLKGPTYSKGSPKISPSRTRKASYARKMPKLRKSRQDSVSDLRSVLGSTLLLPGRIDTS